MAHILRTGTSIFKIGSNVFNIKDLFSYSIATFTGFTNPFGIAVHEPSNRLFISTFSSSAVQVVNLDTMAITATLATGQVQGLHVVNDILYATVHGQTGVKRWDLNTLTQLTQFTTTSVSKYMANNDAKTKLFVPHDGNNTVSKIDISTGTTEQTYTGNMNAPFGVVAHEASNRLFVGNFNSSTITVYNLTSGAFLTSFSAGINAMGLAIDTHENQLLVSGGQSGSAYLRIYNLGTYAFVRVIEPFAWTRDIYISSNNQKYYTFDQTNNRIHIVTKVAS
jgi:DNA-binding beta-propeller fold protein YncE